MEKSTVRRAAIGAAASAVGLIGLSSVAGADDVLEASLRGRNEVLTNATNNRIVGDPNGRGAATVFAADADTLCYALQVSKIEPAGAAHIHRGAAGVNGGIVVDLDPPRDGTSAGCVDALPALVAEILGNPSGFYVNVHNAEYPGGAVRGQLR